MFPSNPQNEIIARHEAATITTLVDILAMTQRTEECRLFQVLGRLEEAQMLLASVTILNIEEDRVIEVDGAALLKTDCDKARLAHQLASLYTSIKDFTQLLANIPRETIEGDTCSAYYFSGMTEQLETIHTRQFLRPSTDRMARSRVSPQICRE